MTNISFATRTTFLPETPRLTIFCVGQDLRRVRAFRSWASQRRLSIRSLMGCYRGITEMSFAIDADDFPEVACWTVAEESVLQLGPPSDRGSREAKLLFAVGDLLDLGNFIGCSRDTALAEESWTLDPTTGCYFICRAGMGA